MSDPGRRDVLRICALVGVGAAFGGGVARSLLQEARLHTVRQTRTRMGTIVTISVAHPDADGAHATVESAFAEMERVEGALTRHQPGAPLARLNATGRLDGTPSELLEVLASALELSERSGGAFDPTVLPVLRAWESAGREGRARPPEAELAEARRRIGWERVGVDGERVTLADPGMGLTLDGIAKGFVVDRTLDRLVSDGAERVLVDAGGDMASGGPGSRRDPWIVGVQDPHRDGPEGLVRLTGGCVATSGDYLHAFSEDRRDHHVIDPRTGRPPESSSSVTVTADRAMLADGLSTALMVMDAADGIALAETTPGAEALVVTKDGCRSASSGFAMTTTTP